MLVSVNWIKDFVDVSGISTADLRTKLTLAVAEVEKVHQREVLPEKIRVAEVHKVEPHPKADKLKLVTFDWGQPELHKVVCGATNVRVGMKTPYAPVETHLPCGIFLQAKDIRGFVSEGMLCSEVELGLGKDADGIMELDDKAPVGEPLRKTLDQKEDTVIDFDNKSLTHRPDLWGYWGLAREFSLALKKPLNNPFDKKWMEEREASFTDATPPVTLKVESDSSCLAYWGLSVDNITVGPSPKWMQARLEAAGLRSINNIVDISNYVMMELGMPLHIFDRDEIKGGRLTIELMGKEGTLKTLDEVERKLLPDDTIIRDDKRPLVLAGIMGGLDSGVSSKTERIFIESANWKAAKLRKTSTRLGLRTDASTRYEKSLDSNNCYRTLLRTLDLVKQLCPKAQVVGRPVYGGENLGQQEKRVLQTSLENITKILGLTIKEEDVLSIFEALDFTVHKKEDIPSRRNPQLSGR